MTLRHPYLLLLLLIYLPLIWWWIRSARKGHATLSMSDLSPFKGKKVSGRAWMFGLIRILQLAAIGFLIVALARPQQHDSLSNRNILGTDIVLAIDISQSMSAPDIKPSRFEAAKKTAKDFIQQRTDDNIGLVVFGGEALSKLPLTNDPLALQSALSEIRMGELSNGTAIGDGLVSAINRVLNGQATSKSIILLTDGTNNAGDVAPTTAADIAAQKGIKVYTIGVGTDRTEYITDPYGISTTAMKTYIDEDVLTEIANKTGGKYFRAKNANTLSEVFKEIDSLEKTRMDVESYERTEEAFMPWVLAALCCFAFTALLRYTLLIKIP